MDYPHSDPACFARDLADVLRDHARPLPVVAALGDAMQALLAARLATLPLPGSGRTLERWQRLAAVAAFDLGLVKLFESHADALAILAELDPANKATVENGRSLAAVWAAEAPGARVQFKPGTVTGEGGIGGQLFGRKAWCSGAAVVETGLLTAWLENDDRPVLALVDLHQPGVRVADTGWNAVGMRATASGTIEFDGARAVQIGAPGAYLARPGFWQGGGGIAACWYGAAVAVARPLLASKRAGNDPHLAAHLGAVDVALCNARAVLHESAAWIDAHPLDDAQAVALRVRASVEAAANEVLSRVGRALGPALLCTNAEHAQRCADLAVFLRQSHAEHDLAALGRKIEADAGGNAWTL